MVRTPPTSNNLRGITKSTVIDLAREMGYALNEAPMTLFDICNSDEVFITGTAVEICPVFEVDEKKSEIGPQGWLRRRLWRRTPTS